MENREQNQLQSLNNAQLEQAWGYLASLTTSEWTPPPPEGLEHLSELEWFLLDQLLQQQMWLRAQSPVH